MLSLAQAPHPILESFNAYKQPNGVLLRWVIKGGNQCNGTKVFRANDELQFEQVNHIPGICGSTTENETYSFFDSIPFQNQYNHYKLELGFQGFSETVSIFFEDFARADHLVLSDHVNGTHRILFSNDQKGKAILQLYDRSGLVLFEQSSLNSHFEFNSTGLRAGVYLFRISGVSASDIVGKIYFAGE